MPFPVARLTDLTVTGDVVTAPGCPNVLVGGLPIACLGDAVSGAVCVGAIVVGNMTVLAGGRPIARVTSSVGGANPATGVPVTTVIAPPCCPTVLTS